MRTDRARGRAAAPPRCCGLSPRQPQAQPCRHRPLSRRLVRVPRRHREPSRRRPASTSGRVFAGRRDGAAVGGGWLGYLLGSRRWTGTDPASGRRLDRLRICAATTTASGGTRA